MVNFFKASKSKSLIGQVIELAIKRLDLNGCGVAHYNKKPVFVSGALPNEVVQAKIIEQKSKFLRANTIEVLETGQQRQTPKCQHFKSCGGCDIQHLVATEHIPFKQDKVTELFHRNGLTAQLPWQTPITDQPWQYRRKARIGVQYGKKGGVTIGFRQKNTNTLTAITSCVVLVEPLQGIFPLLKKAIESLSVTKAIGHIEVIATDKVTVVFRQLKKLSEHDISQLLQLANTHSWQLLLDNGNEIVPITSFSDLSYTLNENLTINFNLKDFIQVNHEVNLMMVSQAIDWLSCNKQDVVLDLFCGLGNFSLPIAKLVDSVIGVEGVDSMVAQASKNAADNQLTNTEFYQANLAENWLEAPWGKLGFTKALLDPARAGAFEALEQLIALHIPTIVYVSCDPATLARDSNLLVSNGYQIVKIAIMDMFSQTKHIETMVLFQKIK